MEGDFTILNTDKFKDVEGGARIRDWFFVAGLKALPIEAADPYLQRVYTLCHRVTKDGHVKPDQGLLLIDPHDLIKMGKSRQKKFTEMLQLDFQPMPEDAAVN